MFSSAHSVLLIIAPIQQSTSFPLVLHMKVTLHAWSVSTTMCGSGPTK